MNGLCVSMIMSATLTFMAQDGLAAPEWVSRQSWVEKPIRYQVVTSDPWVAVADAREQALGLAEKVALEYAAQGRGLPSEARVPRAIISDLMLEDEYVEPMEFDFSPMYRVHLLLKLSPQLRDTLAEHLSEQARQSRMYRIGAGFAFVLICTMVVLAYLRLDDATRGYYSKWLFTAAGGILVASGFLLYKLAV